MMKKSAAMIPATGARTTEYADTDLGVRNSEVRRGKDVLKLTKEAALLSTSQGANPNTPTVTANTCPRKILMYLGKRVQRSLEAETVLAVMLVPTDARIQAAEQKNAAARPMEVPCHLAMIWKGWKRSSPVPLRKKLGNWIGKGGGDGPYAETRHVEEMLPKRAVMTQRMGITTSCPTAELSLFLPSSLHQYPSDRLRGRGLTSTSRSH
jgi:hypothetical protein